MFNKLHLLANSPKTLLLLPSVHLFPLKDMKLCKLWCTTREQQPLLPLNILTHNSALLLHAINRQRFNLQRGRENERAALGDKEARDKHEANRSSSSTLTIPTLIYLICLQWYLSCRCDSHMTTTQRAGNDRKPVSNQQPQEVTSICPPDKLAT